MITAIITALLIFGFGVRSVEKQGNNELNYSQQSVFFQDTVTNYREIVSHKNQNAYIKGRVQMFRPRETGKGANHMFWQWEIMLPDSSSFPLVSMDKSDGESVNFEEYENQTVYVYALVYYGIIIGDSNPEHQSMTGYRIDATGVDLINRENFTGASEDTCWIIDDIINHRKSDAFIAGKLLKYVPPFDNSKLGDEYIWDWELELQDGNTIPLTDSSGTGGLELEGFVNRDVFVKAFVFYGIIFGRSNTANLQGTRLDAREIYINESGYGMPFFQRKIKFDLNLFNDAGLKELPGGEYRAINYEFCIPADEDLWLAVAKIDNSLDLHKGSKGRSGCGENEWLCIGYSHRENFKEIIKALAGLHFIRKITETFWE